MTSVECPSLDDVRQKFGPWPAEQRIPPSAEELVGLGRVFPGVSIASDRIAIPIQRFGSRPLFFGMVGLAFMSAIALPFVWFTPEFRPVFWSWFVPHLAWTFALLLLLSHLLRIRSYDLVIFPSSPCCYVRKGSLVVNSFYETSPFVSDGTRVASGVHLGVVLLAGPKSGATQRIRAAAVLNRYVLFGHGSTSSPQPRSLFYVPGRFARWIIEGPNAVHFDQDKLVLRIRKKTDFAFGFVLLSFFTWMFLVGPLVYSVVSRALGHGVLVATVGLSVLAFRLEDFPGSLTLLASRRTVILRRRFGAERTIHLDENPFWPSTSSFEGDRSMVYFLDGRKRYLVALEATEGNLFEEEIDALGAYLGLPPRPPDRRDRSI